MNEGTLTVFGATMLELMARRGFTEWSTLSALLRERGGHDFRPSRISNWAYGRHAVAPAFPRAFASVLNLTDEEREKLAVAFTFGQDERIDVSFERTA